MERNHAYAISADNMNCILYDDRGTKEEQLFLMAHEVGHILMGHHHCEFIDHMELEKNANTFASVMLAIELFFTYHDKSTVLS